MLKHIFGYKWFKINSSLAYVGPEFLASIHNIFVSNV